MSPRRRRLPSSAPALDNDDILCEILLRLPPLPSSLPRASLVCKRWRRLVADPYFLRRFRGHHGKPPLLGFFNQCDGLVFTSVLDSLYSIPAERFSLRLDSTGSRISDCRHGRVLFLDTTLDYFLVWDPVTGKQHQVHFPPVFSSRSKDSNRVTNGAVLCAASEQGHVHGSCHSSPFKVILLACNNEAISACVYSSETSWGYAVSLLWPRDISGVAYDCPNTLAGNSIYWLLNGRRFGILKFDLCRQSLEAIELPPDAVRHALPPDAALHALFSQRTQFLITPADDGGLNFLHLLGFSAQVWKWKANCDGGAGWMLGSNFDLSSVLSLEAGVGMGRDGGAGWMRGSNFGFNSVLSNDPKILGMVEDENTILLSTYVGDFMLHLESMQFKKLPMRVTRNNAIFIHYPFTSFYSTAYMETTISDKEIIQINSSNSSSSTMPPTQGAKENNSTVVSKQQPEPTQEFSVANCIHAMREMVDLSDEEKVLSCDLFIDAANREIFLSLDGILRTLWLKRQLTKNRWE